MPITISCKTTGIIETAQVQALDYVNDELMINRFSSAEVYSKTSTDTAYIHNKYGNSTVQVFGPIS